jgi:hypothetical protein
MSGNTPEAPPLSKVLDAAERRPTIGPPCDCGARTSELVLAIVVAGIAGLFVGGALFAFLPGALGGDGAHPEQRLMVPIEKCIRIRGGR